MLRDKHVLLGVTGSIAAYKTAYLIRDLKKAGASVRVIMTPFARSFITPLTLSTLADEPVHTDLIADPDRGEWTDHVSLARWADLFMIAPATANTIAKMATGQADELLLTTFLSYEGPLHVAPAMDREMIDHPATRDNLTTLKERGTLIVAGEEGELASGAYGPGRMAEPEVLFQRIEAAFEEDRVLKGKKLLVTAGPTREPIDPVRFIGNHSTGKMGFAIAEVAASQGAEVELITGPTHLDTKIPGINVTRVNTAREMAQACKARFPDVDIAIMAAAVADHRAAEVAREKLKKNEAAHEVKLEPTEDILMSLGQAKKNGQVLVGFALETHNEEENAKKKLEEKNLDLIVMNSMFDEGAAFGYDTNRVTILSRDGEKTKSELRSKQSIAKMILEKVRSPE